MQTQYRKMELVSLANLKNTNVLTEQDIENQYDAFNINGLQHYNPMYSSFFEMNDVNVKKVTLKHRYYVHDLNTVTDYSKYDNKSSHTSDSSKDSQCFTDENGELVKKNVFIKFSPLLDPVKYMIGKYDNQDDSIRTLPDIYNILNIPNIEEPHRLCHPKLLDKNNASYIDCFFSYLSSQLLHRHGLINGIDFYGSYLGIQEKYKMNISDDMEYLCTSRFFNENVGKLFTVSSDIPTDDQSGGGGSRAHKQKLTINGSIKTHNISMIDLDIDEHLSPLDDTAKISGREAVGNRENYGERSSKEFVPTTELSQDALQNIDENIDEIVYEKPQSNRSSISSDSDNNSDVNYSSTDEDDMDMGDSKSDQDEESLSNDSDSVTSDNESNDRSDSESDSDSEISEMDNNIYVYMQNFPVQMICLEKCTGTLDSLFEKSNMDIDTSTSALLQIIMTLLSYQRAFSFTHNDLHTNNIVYIDTDIEFLYYQYNKKIYKVPTYGKIYKIIDFGRAIYRFQGKIFCSDSFAPGGDAATQYNCEPYLNNNKPRLDPNPSFDLCRLGCSLYDFVIDDENTKDMDAIQKLIYKWCFDDNHKNILYKKNGEERYPNFKLYKMISRTVHQHAPHMQLELPLFKQFVLTSKDAKKINKKEIINIDDIPSYM